MIGKLILLATLLYGAWRLWRMISPRPPVAPPRQDSAFEPMSRCRACGVHLPARSLSDQGHCGRCS